jgi:hypothetical protein
MVKNQEDKVQPVICHEGTEECRGIVSSLLFFNLAARWRWVVNTMPRPLCPLE